MDQSHQRSLPPEVIDYVLGYLDPTSLSNARCVSRQWRSVADLYVKRRLRIVNLKKNDPTTCSVAFSQQIQKKNLLNNFHKFPQDKIRFALGPHGPNCRQRQRKHNSALFFALVVGLDWASNMTTLELSQCMTVGDWMSTGNQILRKLKNLVSLKIAFSENHTLVVSPSYADIDFKKVASENGNLRLVEFELWYSSFQNEVPGTLDQIVTDVFSVCTSLTTFQLCVKKYQSTRYSKMNVTITQNTEREDVNTKKLPSWKVEISPAIHYLDSPAVQQFVSILLSQVKLKSMITPINSNVLKMLEETPGITKHLDFMSITSANTGTWSLSSLVLSPAFKNVKRLYWDFSRFGPRDTFPSTKFKPTFGSVHTIELEPRSSCSASDNRILLNLHKMAPSVKRLVMHVSHHFHGDCQLALEVAKSFRMLEHLVLMSNENEVRYWNPLDLEKILPCLRGLTSITIAFADSSLLLAYAQIFAKASVIVKSIKKLGFFVLKSQSKRERRLDPNELGVPRTVDFASGPWNEARISEVYGY